MSVVENIWGIIVLLSIIWVIYDLFTYNRAMSTLKKILWIIIVFTGYNRSYTLLSYREEKMINLKPDAFLGILFSGPSFIFVS